MSKMRKPWLYLPANWLHYVSPWALKIYSRLKSAEPANWKSLQWRHLYFPNPLGTAGGLDKNALHIKNWQFLGAGFLEVGTVTPEPQRANPGKILDRSLKHLSLWNNMGFPNRGLNYVKRKLSYLAEHNWFGGNFAGQDVSVSTEKSGAGQNLTDSVVSQNHRWNTQSIPLFINIGKNRQTPLSQAVEDYKKSLEALHPFASAFVINISSPNTEGLRELFGEKALPPFLKSLKEIIARLNQKIPLILKLSPDEKDFLRIIEQSIEAGIDGWCICNSTKERVIPHLFPERGGVSGKLLASQSLNLLKRLKAYINDNEVKDKLVISCGGVLTAQNVVERLQEGADLVQVYSALVFEGPGFFQSVFKELSSR